MAGAGSRKGKARVFQKSSEKRANVNAAVTRALNLRAEKKFYTATAAGNTAIAGTMWAMSQGVIQGDSVSTRDGSQITLQEVGLKIIALCPTAAVSAGIRVVLFYDKMNLGTLPGVTEVLANSTLISPYSVAQNLTNRFVILADVTRTFTAGGIQETLINIQRKCRHKITYNNAADVAGANGKGAVFFLILTNDGVNPPTYDFTFHLKYLDM